jgi:uncharacterized iron-regulated membrane protein
MRRLVGQIHLWTGLLCCVPFVLIGLTGSILVFEDELRAAFAPVAQAQPGEAHAAGAIIAAARAVAPQDYVPAVYIAAPAPGRLASVRLAPAGGRAGPGEAVRVDVDPVSLAAYPNSSEDFLRQVFFLHSTLLMKNREGRVVVGWFGVGMLVMAVSGLVNWWPRRAGWRAAFSVSRRSQGYRLWRELHGAAGIWGLAVLAAVSFGGVYLAFPEAVRSVVDRVLPARDLRAAASSVKIHPLKDAVPIGVDDAMSLAVAGVPDGRPTVVFLPAKPDRPYRIALSRAGQARHEIPVIVLVDPWAHRVVETFDPHGFSPGERLLAAQHALHSGQGFGPVWKTLVFLCGLLPALFTATGIAMWLKRRRAATPVAPLLDRVYPSRSARE